MKKPGYMITGLNDLNTWMLANKKFASTTLMHYIERQMVTRLVLSKKEATQENLDREFNMEANRHGGAAMMYRHYANQHMDLVYKKSMVKLEHKEQMIKELQAVEYEDSLYKLQAKNENAKSIFKEIHDDVKALKSLFGEISHDNPASKSQSKLFDRFLQQNPIMQAAQTFASEIEVDAPAFVKKMQPAFGLFGDNNG